MALIILIGTIVLVVGTLLRRWFRVAAPEDKRALVLLSLWTFGGLGLLVLIVTGRFFHALGWALMTFMALSISGSRAKRRRSQKGAVAHSSDALGLKEAHDILGLKPGASDKKIHAAYLKLIQKNHPDSGGSDYLSAQINNAYDVLMDPKRKRFDEGESQDK